MEGTNIKQSKEIKILFYLLSLTVFFDALNGVITMYYPGFLELFIPLIRVLFIVFYFKFLLKIDGQKGLRVLMLSIIFIVTILFVSIFNSYSQLSYLFDDVMYGVKLLNFYVLLNLLIELTKVIKFDWFNQILLNNSYLITLLIIVPTKLNLARQTYVNSNLGSMGFYIANNSTNITLVMVSFFLVYNLWYRKKNKLINLCFFLLSVYSLWLQSTKTSFFIIIILVMVNLYLYLTIKVLKKYNTINNILIFLLVVLLFTLTILIFFEKIDEMLNYLFEDFLLRQRYQFKNFSGNKLYFITSGRILFLENILESLMDKNNIISWFFGLGISNFKNLYGKITEMDLFDIYFSTGLLGIYITYIYTFKTVFKIKKEESYQKYIYFLIWIVIGYSIFAGHVYVDIISTTIFSIVIASMHAKKVKGVFFNV